MLLYTVITSIIIWAVSYFAYSFTADTYVSVAWGMVTMYICIIYALRRYFHKGGEKKDEKES